MRVMDITPFPRRIEIRDLGYFLGRRMGETIVLWPDQAISLLGYMCHPNDEAGGMTSSPLFGVGRAPQSRRPLRPSFAGSKPTG